MKALIPRHLTTKRNQRDCRPRLEALECRNLLSVPGTLDTTFGSGGLVTAPSGRGFAEAIQSDGKIVVAGLVYTSSGPHAFRLARYNTNGSLDSSFGSGGTVTTSPTRYGGDLLGVAIQSDGKIVAVGDAIVSQSPFSTDFAFAVARYNANGSLDTTFGGGKKPTGIVVTNLESGTGSEGANALVIQPDGKIVAAGVATPPGAGNEITMLRYNSNGTLDSTFGSNGVVIANVMTVADAIVLQSDGKIVAAGGAGRTAGVARYLPNGQLDTSFGSSGALVGIVPPGDTDSVATSLVIQGDGFVVAGYSYVSGSFDTTAQATLARLTSGGQFDTTFGNGGFAVTNLPAEGNAIALASNGDLLVAGPSSVTSGSDFALAAFLPTGVLDTTFGSSGQASVDFNGGYDVAHAIAVQSDGEIVLAGDTNISNTNSFALARFTGFGTITALAATPAPTQVELTPLSQSSGNTVLSADQTSMAAAWVPQEQPGILDRSRPRRGTTELR